MFGDYPKLVTLPQRIFGLNHSAKHGIGRVHRYHLKELKCASPKRRLEMAARLGESRAARCEQNRHAMPASVRYFDLLREMRDAYNHRLRLVESVKERDIKPTARLSATSALTVRKSWRRYLQHSPSGLKAQSRAPHHHPLKTPPTVERKRQPKNVWTGD